MLIDNKTRESSGYTGFFYIKFSKWPLDDNLAKEDIYTLYPSKFHASIQLMPFWNWDGSGNGNFKESIDYNLNKIEMNVNGKTFKNVFVLSSGNNTIIEVKRANDRIYYRDVNVIYYDEFEGIIGFDDLNGNEWRLEN